MCQFPITMDIDENYSIMEKIINENSLVDMLIFPEGCLSGYITEGHLLSKLNTNKINKYLKKLQILAIQYKISIWFGTIIYENGNYYNSAIGISSDGLNWIRNGKDT